MKIEELYLKLFSILNSLIIRSLDLVWKLLLKEMDDDDVDH